MPNEQPVKQPASRAVPGELPPGNAIDFRLRAVQSHDYELQYQLYASVRATEMALMTEWNSIQKEAFLRFQHKAQQRHFRRDFPQADYQIVCRDGQGIGRLFVDNRGDVMELLDITLLPPFRRQGIGNQLLQGLLADALLHNRQIMLRVEADNPATRLFRRLGFVATGEVSFYEILHWRPDYHHLYHHVAGS